jgi:hypothetical protein
LTTLKDGKAFKAVWKEYKIEMLEKQLDDYRKEIAIRLLVLLNARTETLANRQKESETQAKKGNADIIEVMSINHERLRTALESQKSEIILLNQTNW